MRETYTSLKNAFLDGTQNTGSTDVNLLSFFQRQLGVRYQLALAQIQNWTTQVQKTATTVASQQYYHYPPGIVNIETVTVQIGSIYYPVTVVNSQRTWDQINELLISTTTIPQFLFPRRDDFGIWPIPQGAYSLVLNYDLRDRKLTNDDYITGSATVTNNSQTVTLSGATLTAGMVNRWFNGTTATGGDGFWYRINAVDTVNSKLTLETSYEGTTASSVTYTIGESPELPEEAHILLVSGVLSDFYSLIRNDIGTATWHNNVFWTGDGNNNDRSGNNVLGGIIGIQQRYATRSNSKIIKRKTNTRYADTKLWASKILPS